MPDGFLPDRAPPRQPRPRPWRVRVALENDGIETAYPYLVARVFGNLFDRSGKHLAAIRGRVLYDPGACRWYFFPRRQGDCRFDLDAAAALIGKALLHDDDGEILAIVTMLDRESPAAFFAAHQRLDTMTLTPRGVV